VHAGSVDDLAGARAGEGSELSLMWVRIPNRAIDSIWTATTLPVCHLPRICDSRRLELNFELRIGEATASLFSILVKHPK
jgi:hypothetical protein